MTIERRTTLPLRNGAEVEAGLGQAYLGILEGLLSGDRPLFDALLELARGGAIDATAAEGLKRGLALRPDGTPLPGLTDVLLSAYQATPEGPVLANPFRLSDPEQARALDTIDDASHAWLLRQIQRGDGGDRRR